MIDFAPEKKQLSFQKLARDFALNVLRPAEVELDKMADPDEAFKSDLFWNAMKQAYALGFHRMGIAEQYGGLGLDPQTTALVWEELAYGGVGITASLLAAPVAPLFLSRLAAGKKDLIEQYVIPFCEDREARHVTAWGSSEPDIGSDGSNYYDTSVFHKVSAVKDGDEFVIEGSKSGFVSNAGIADTFLTFACMDPSKGICGSGVFLIPLGERVKRGKAEDRIGMRALNQADVFFDKVRIPESHMIMPAGPGYPMIHNAIKTVGNIGVGYLALGLMRAAFDDALAYAKERVQFGKPIVQHQAVGFRLFECYQAIEAARAYLWKASWRLKQDMMGDLKVSAGARVFATNQAMKHTVEMVQILGGYGVSKEYGVEKYMRDAKLLQIMDATNDIMALKALALIEKM